MGLMGNLRNRAGLVIFVIGFAIVAFLLGDVMQSGMPLWMQSQNQVGNVDGKSIDYQDFNLQVNQAAEQIQQQMGGAPETPQLKMYAVQQVWNQFISKELLDAEIEKIGITVGSKELNSLVKGPNYSSVILQTIVNPQTGQFDPGQLDNIIIESKNENSAIGAQWEALLENVIQQRLSEKYSNLLNASVYVTALEAQDEYTAKNKLANFNYVLLDYATVNSADIKLTDADFNSYYDKYKNAYKTNEETRSLEYIIVDGKPTKNDSATTLATIEELKTQFIASTTDSLFAISNADSRLPVTYYKKGQLNAALDSVVFNTAVGNVVGPLVVDNSYQIAKVLDTKFSPDSVQVSHIILNPVAEGGVTQALAKADSIKRLIANGADFAALAVQFSQDENSKANGGEFGTFTRGQLAPQLGEAFEESIFLSKTGDIIVKETQYGVHIMKIGKQVGNSKIVKLAVVDKLIASGKETTEFAYNKANTFLSEANSQNFADVAANQKLNLQVANRVLAMDIALNGKEVSRDLIRWAFESKDGDVTDKVFEYNDSFIVAKLTSINPKGIQPLTAIKKEITQEVMKQVKARMLKEKMNNALNGSTTIDQVAQKLGKSPVVVENIVQANPVIPGISLESTVIGTVFGLQPNKPSKAIEGTQGIYVVQVNSFVNPNELVETERKNQQKQMTQSRQQRSWGSIFQALQNSANIDDNRIRFY